MKILTNLIVYIIIIINNTTTSNNNNNNNAAVLAFIRSSSSSSSTIRQQQQQQQQHRVTTTSSNTKSSWSVFQTTSSLYLQQSYNINNNNNNNNKINYVATAAAAAVTRNVESISTSNSNNYYNILINQHQQHQQQQVPIPNLNRRGTLTSRRNNNNNNNNNIIPNNTNDDIKLKEMGLALEQRLLELAKLEIELQERLQDLATPQKQFVVTQQARSVAAATTATTTGSSTAAASSSSTSQQQREPLQRQPLQTQRQPRSPLPQQQQQQQHIQRQPPVATTIAATTTATTATGRRNGLVINPSSLQQKNTITVHTDNPSSISNIKKLWDTSKVTTIQGGSLRTWSFMNPMVNRVHVMLKTDGRPLDADIELWQGPENTPHKMKVYIEDGGVRRFSTFINTPSSPNTICIRNTGHLEFPLIGCVNVDDNIGDAVFDLIEQNQNENNSNSNGSNNNFGDIIQGGALRTYAFEPIVNSVVIMIKTDGRPLNARIELLQGPNNNKQVMAVYTENGFDRPFVAIIQTPGSGNVVRILNVAPVEFPLHATVLQHELISDPYNTLYLNDGIQLGYQW